MDDQTEKHEPAPEPDKSEQSGEAVKGTQLDHNVQTTIDNHSSEEDNASVDTPSENALEELKTQLTRRGTINPDSPYFSTEKFLHDRLARAKEQGIKRQSTGVLFRGLVVLGYGSGFTHQRTVGSVATGILRLRSVIRERRHPHMKTILYSMDGVVKEGEMLLVLGKPGSGATTFLKTIAGEWKGYASVSGGTSLFTPDLHRYPLQWSSRVNHAQKI